MATRSHDQMETEDPPSSVDDGHRVIPQLTSSPGRGDDDWVHLGGETTHLRESEDIVSWHHKVQSRLKEIPSSPTDYHSVLHTIQQLKELFGEVVERRANSEAQQSKLAFSFDDLYRTLSIKQDSVFKVLVSLQRGELEEIERRLGRVEESLEQEEGDYQHTLTILQSYKSLGEELECCRRSLQTLLDHPQPARQGSFVQQQVRQIEQDTVGPKSQVFRESEGVRNKVTNQLLFCQDLERRLELRTTELEESLRRKREECVAELSEVEHWLSGLYSTLCQEPLRDSQGGAYAEDGGCQLESAEGEPQDPQVGGETDLDHVLETSSPVHGETDLDEVLRSRPLLTEQKSIYQL